jgi:hypothetical protein
MGGDYSACWTEQNYMHWFLYGDRTEIDILQMDINVFLITPCRNIVELHKICSWNLWFNKMCVML